MTGVLTRGKRESCKTQKHREGSQGKKGAETEVIKPKARNAKSHPKWEEARKDSP